MGYHYEIHYKKGNDNTTIDALSRLSQPQLRQMTLDASSPELLHKLEESWELDPDRKGLIFELQRQNGSIKAYSWDGKFLRRNGKLVVGKSPALRQFILEWLHASAQGGHSGIQATY